MGVPKMMIYRDTKIDVNFQVVCAACPPYMFTDEDAEASKNETITMYPTMTHAIEAGWVATKDKLYCRPSEDFAWICPSCAKEIKWRLTNDSRCDSRWNKG